MLPKASSQSTTNRFVLLVVEGHAGHGVEAHAHRGGEDEGDAEERQVPVLVLIILSFLLTEDKLIKQMGTHLAKRDL